MISSEPSETVESGSSCQPVPDPRVALDEAWRVFSLVNDWLRHAETKLGVILAAAGVSGGVLFTLIDGDKWGGHGAVWSAVAAVAGAAILIAGILAMIGLIPVLNIGRNTKVAKVPNPLYFIDIATTFRDLNSYPEVVLRLAGHPADLLTHVTQQIEANAKVAQRKFAWANRALLALLVGLVTLGALAGMAALPI